MEAPAVLTRLSSTSPPAYEQSVPVPVTTTEGYSEVTADVTTNDHSLSQERIAGCCKSLPVHKQSLASGTLSVLCTALVLYSCVSTRWLVRPMKRLWMGVGEEIAERTSSAMTLGLYQICEETELNQCFTCKSLELKTFKRNFSSLPFSTSATVLCWQRGMEVSKLLGSSEYYADVRIVVKWISSFSSKLLFVAVAR